MPYKLISLVFLLFIFITNKAYSESEFLLPAKKPSIFKKFDNKINDSINTSLPQAKPKIKIEIKVETPALENKNINNQLKKKKII